VAKRSVGITLVNNTSFLLTYYQDMLCHGFYSNNLPPPATVAPNSTVQWESQDNSPSWEGTEGWVKYTCPQAGGDDELVFIYWNNPYFEQDLKSPPAPITIITSVSDVDTNTQGHTNSPYCSTGTPSVWPNPVPPAVYANITPGPAPATQLTLVTTAGTNPPSYNVDTGDVVFEGIFVWTVILAPLLGDVNLSFTLCLATKNSVDQHIRNFYDGKKGLLALAAASHQPSLRKLLGM
jgi:hypothetical protein